MFGFPKFLWVDVDALDIHGPGVASKDRRVVFNGNGLLPVTMEIPNPETVVGLTVRSRAAAMVFSIVASNVTTGTRKQGMVAAPIVRKKFVVMESWTTSRVKPAMTAILNREMAVSLTV